MASIELKNQVREKIESINDAYLLEEILNLIDFASDNDKIYIIPQEHQIELDISIEQMKNGQTIPNDIVDLKVQKWLSK
ncbi:MAG: hypothetical protein IPM42_17620 [Saprospiraceae bacterium]|nr:hypothetical protein [Saprospiraceae bacterium]